MAPSRSLPHFAGVGVAGQHLHAEGVCQLGYDAAHGAQADKTQAAALKLQASMVYVAVHGVFPASRLDVSVQIAKFASGEREHETKGEFRNGAGVPAGGVDHQHAVLRGSVQVDVIEGGAADAHEAKVGGVLE